MAWLTQRGMMNVDPPRSFHWKDLDGHVRQVRDQRKGIPVRGRHRVTIPWTPRTPHLQRRDPGRVVDIVDSASWTSGFYPIHRQSAHVA